ncbi:porin [Adhaeribacter arboris]|uniref:Porin n=1 Tax=Adhaeribacter arboris TaxID=2072846 RepID=A0A2T2YA10_9BACT|nr:porin [Adhaeribacter arboris]PSR52278.1 porin [Adhaeribacter arboris]
MKKRFLLLIVTFVMGVFVANAQSDSTAAATATPTEEGSLSISGYVDAYYLYNTNKPESGLNQGRIFDLLHNNFSLGLVQTALTYTKGKLKVVADLTYGPNADLGNFSNYRTLNANKSDITSTSFAIKQAYGTYNFTDKLALTVGQYGTHIGYELIDAPLNYNYSLSYLFGNGPFYHTGAKLDFAASDKVGLMFGVVNGWDALQDFNNKKTLTAQVHLMPAEGFHLYANWIGGDEYNGNSAFGVEKGSYTSLFDLTTAFQVSDAFKIGLNAAHGSFITGAASEVPGTRWMEDATWWGAALYLNYAITDKFGLGLRAEKFDDKHGVRYFDKIQATEFTLTGDIKLADGKFNLKPEVRFDSTKDPFFTSGASTLKKHQTTIGAAVVYSFDGRFGK